MQAMFASKAYDEFDEVPVDRTVGIEVVDRIDERVGFLAAEIAHHQLRTGLHTHSNSYSILLTSPDQTMEWHGL